MLRSIPVSVVLLAASLALSSAPAYAGTQDFTLVNETGAEIYARKVLLLALGSGVINLGHAI